MYYWIYIYIHIHISNNTYIHIYIHIHISNNTYIHTYTYLNRAILAKPHWHSNLKTLGGKKRIWIQKKTWAVHGAVLAAKPHATLTLAILVTVPLLKTKKKKVFSKTNPCDTQTGISRCSAPVKKKLFFSKTKTHATPTMAFLVTVPLFYNFFCFTFLFWRCSVLALEFRVGVYILGLKCRV